MYGQILNETIEEGGNYSDGVYMKSKIKGKTFKGQCECFAFGCLDKFQKVLVTCKLNDDVHQKILLTRLNLILKNAKYNIVI